MEDIVCFKPGLSKPILKKFSEFICKVFQQKCWNLGDRKFKDLSGKQIFNSALEVYGEVMWLDYNKDSSICMKIAIPACPYLQTIYLGDNLMASLEGLTFLNAPQLRRISLNDNLLHKVDIFQKTRFPKLQYLSFNGNKIQNFDSFIRVTLNHAESIRLQDQGNKNWENLNVFWMLKSQLPELAIVSFSAHEQLSPERILIKLKLCRRKSDHPCIEASGINYSPTDSI